MPLSYVTYTGDGSQTSYSITFNYLSETVVTGASPKGILVYLDYVKQTSGYTVNSTTVDFTVAPGSGVNVALVRSTPRTKADRLIDFADASVLTEAQLDTSALQLLYIAQEAFEQSTSGGGATPTYLPFSDGLDAWDAESQRLTRVAAPTGGTDATNKTYVDDGFLPYDSGGGTYDASRSSVNQKIDGIEDPQGNQQAATKKYVDDVATWGVAGIPQAYKFTGTGSTNQFSLTGAPYAEAEMLVVGLNGVLQLPVDDYTVTGGATDSILNFVSYTPTAGEVINVLNFGKARFLDSALLEDDSITTAMLQDNAVTTAKLAVDAVTEGQIADNAVRTEHIQSAAVTNAELGPDSVGTSEIAENAVTSDEIADDSVDFARLKDTGFASLANSESTAKVLRINSGTANLTTGTLAAADISDFNSTVTAQPLSAFAPATGSVNMDSNFLLNLPTPTNDTHAATKAYVDTSTQSAMKGTLIADTSLASGAASFTVEGWYDSKYQWYEVIGLDFGVNEDNRAIGVLFRNDAGSYPNGTGDYTTYWSGETGSAWGGSLSGFCGVVSTWMDNGTNDRCQFRLRLHQNGSYGSSSVKRHVEFTATGRTGSSISSIWTGPFASGMIMLNDNTNPISGFRFQSKSSFSSSSTNGQIRAGARVLIYGYEGLV